MNNYCIYTDQFLDNGEISSEHIIPLSLGGVNGFEVDVEKEANKLFGSKIDGKLSNDFLVLLDRKNHNARGHSNKKVIPVWNKVRVRETGEPIQIRFEEVSKTKWISPITKKEINKEEYRGKSIEITQKLDLYVTFQFVAKVALAAGYFIYGDLFKNNADTQSLREFVSAEDLHSREAAGFDKLRFTDRFHHKEKDTGDYLMFKGLSSLRNSSAVIIMLCESEMILTVSILGKYLATVSFDCDTTNFPNDGKHRLGHVVYLNSTDNIETMSFYDAVSLLAKKLNIDCEK